MKSYQQLQKIYAQPEIAKQCVDINFAYAYICAMASSNLPLEQWMPHLFSTQQNTFSSEALATNFAETVLAVHSQTVHHLENDIPLTLAVDNQINNKAGLSDATITYTQGYLHALSMLENLQPVSFEEGSDASNLQQTCLLLLDKIASWDTTDSEKLAMFELLPSHSECIDILPTLLCRYGYHCLKKNS